MLLTPSQSGTPPNSPLSMALREAPPQMVGLVTPRAEESPGAQRADGRVFARDGGRRLRGLAHCDEWPSGGHGLIHAPPERKGTPGTHQLLGRGAGFLVGWVKFCKSCVPHTGLALFL